MKILLLLVILFVLLLLVEGRGRPARGGASRARGGGARHAYKNRHVKRQKKCYYESGFDPRSVNYYNSRDPNIKCKWCTLNCANMQIFKNDFGLSTCEVNTYHYGCEERFMCVDENAKFPRQFKLATAFCMIYAGCKLNPRVNSAYAYESYLTNVIVPKSRQFIQNFQNNGAGTIGEIRSIVLGSTSVENMLRFKLSQDVISGTITSRNMYAHPIVRKQLPSFISTIDVRQWPQIIRESVLMTQRLQPQFVPENEYMRWVDQFAVASYNSLAKTRAMRQHFAQLRQGAINSATRKIHTGRMVARYSAYQICAAQENRANAHIQFAHLDEASRRSDEQYSKLISIARSKLGIQ